MKVILKQDYENVGRAGSIVNVSEGFFRNYLHPKGIAIVATDRSLAQLEHKKRLVAAKIARDLKNAESLKQRIESLSIKIEREVGEEDRLFGSVTTRDISEALAVEGINIDHRKIILDKPIKHIGIFQALVKITKDITAKLNLWVVAK